MSSYSYKNPFEFETVNVGLNDSFRFIKMLNVSKITADKSIPRFIHGDIAFANDAYGLACSYIKGWTEIYAENEIRADSLYKGKYFTVSGTVRSVR